MLEATRVAAGIKRWPSNALRHSFASYHLAHFNDAAGSSSRNAVSFHPHAQRSAFRRRDARQQSSICSFSQLAF
jgi:hypothetical protein